MIVKKYITNITTLFEKSFQTNNKIAPMQLGSRARKEHRKIQQANKREYFSLMMLIFPKNSLQSHAKRASFIQRDRSK